MSEKVCHDCGESFPATADNFKASPEGTLGPRCRACLRSKKKEQKAVSREKTMYDVEQTAVSSFLANATTGGENIPHSSEVLEKVMLYLGGVNGFAGCLVKQMFDSPPGSATRTKMLEAVLRLIVKNTEMGGAKKPLEQWSDEELEGELDSRLKKIAVQFGGRIVDGTFATEASPAQADTLIGLAGGVPVLAAQGASGGDSEPSDRGPEAVSADGAPEGDTRKPRKRNSRNRRQS